MPVRCPLQAVLGQAPERLKNDTAVASARRRMPGRRGIDSDAEATLLSPVLKVRMPPLHQWYRPWPNGRASGARGPLVLEEW
jgi:hypothetical protein